MFDPNLPGYKRVSKRMARELYQANIPVTMCANKMYPFGGWAHGYRIQKSDIDAREDNWTFDSLSNNYQSYNCTYETGYYPAYYVCRSDITTRTPKVA